MPVYDKAKWHFEGDFPKSLPIYQGYVHIGFFLAWAIERDLAGALLTDDFAEEVAQFRSGEISGPRLLQITDGVLDDQMLSDEGNRFTLAYYEDLDDGYFTDYPATFAKEESIYHVQDTRENFAKIRKKLDARFDAWRQTA
ncbi:MAG: hypothetical protein V4710_11375 [Verrucomicrobiota bacterium]